MKQFGELTREWISSCRVPMSAIAFTSYKRGTADWEDSLVQLPEGE